MQSNFMFLFLTFFLVVTFSTFESDGHKNLKGMEKPQPLATISKIEPMQKQEQQEEIPVMEKLPFSAFTTEVQFKKGKLTVPLSAKKEIKEMFYRARKEGKIKAAKIISWADQALPLKKKKLSSAQMKLVEDRNDRIEAYLEMLDLRMVVGKISMAERPEAMEGILSREDTKLMRTFEKSQDPNLSKSIVMFILKNDAKK